MNPNKHPNPNPRAEWRAQDGRIRRARRYWGIGPEFRQPAPKMPGRDYVDHRGSWERRLQDARTGALIRLRRAANAEARTPEQRRNLELANAIIRGMGRTPARDVTRADVLREHRAAVGCTHIAAGLKQADMLAMAQRCVNETERASDVFMGALSSLTGYRRAA